MGGLSESPQVQRQDIERQAGEIGADLVDVVADLAVCVQGAPDEAAEAGRLAQPAR